MARCDDHRTSERNLLTADYLNARVKPVECNAGKPAQQSINHALSCSRHLSGTLSRIISARTMLMVTVSTAARYAMPVPIEGSSPSTVSPQISGPAIAAAREE